ncbi:MAG: methyltransferase domain-containing protein [Dehalococcoidia bacterium]|nr:methyltransferase domain-containing protein [Dehalococcoidia bacterium]
MTQLPGDLLQHPKYPRASRYDPQWVMSNAMGPNVLWLTEWLVDAMDLRPGMRVLDMGCGRALSSVFLAKEFGVEVWATDLWTKPTENWGRIREAGVDGQVFPIHAEAHQLPFAQGFFDAALSMDAYQYFGTDNLYLSYFARFVKPGGQIGIVVPGLVQEFEKLPEHLAPYWEPDYSCFHSPAWWRRHWERSGQVEVSLADLLEDGWRDWLRWEEASSEKNYPSGPKEMEMLRVDAGRNLTFVRVVGRVS